MYKEEDAKSLPISNIQTVVPVETTEEDRMEVGNVPPAEPSWRDSDEAQMQNLKEEGVTIRERDRQ